MTKPTLAPNSPYKSASRSRTDLSELQEAFLDWLTDPEGGNALGTESQASFATSIGTTPSTLSKWKKEPLFVKAWEKRLATSNVSPEKMQKLMDKTYAIATSDLVEGAKGYGDQLKAIELFTKMVGRMAPEKIMNVSEEKEAIDMTDEEMAEAFERKAAELRGEQPHLRVVA